MKHTVRRLLIPFDYLLLALSFLMPRDKRLWCFGAKFGGNAKYLFIHLNSEKEMDCGYKYVWIGEEDVQVVQSLGYTAYRRWSIKGIWNCLRAGVYIYNSYPSNINLYTVGRAKLINLWHGIALKSIDRQIKVGPMVKIYQSKGLINELRYLNFRLRPDLVLSTSPTVSNDFSEAFGVPVSHCIEGLYPRCELFMSPLSVVDEFVDKYENSATKRLRNQLKQYEYVYVYMPTFRDSGDDFLNNCGFDLDKINSVMVKNNRVFLLKLHPDSKLQITKEYSNVIQVAKDVDIYPILPYSHCLVTDFSSIYFDYLLMEDKQIILFVPDYDEYISKSRNLLYNYDEIMKGRKAEDFNQLLSLMSEINPIFEIDGKEQIKNKFWDYKCSNMNELTESIIKRIDE